MCERQRRRQNTSEAILQRLTGCRNVAPSTAPAGYTIRCESDLRKACGRWGLKTCGGSTQKMNFVSLPRSTPQQTSQRLRKLPQRLQIQLQIQ